MGGGTMIRGMTRLVGAATAGTAAVVPSSSTVFCQATTQEPLNVSSVNAFRKEGYGSLPSKPMLDVRFINPDDLEHSSDEDWGKVSYSHLVFAPGPSEEEVDEATKELQAAFHLSIPPLSPTAAERSDSKVENEQAEVSTIRVVDQEKVVVEKALPSLTTGLGLLAAGSSSVYQAFHLLQTDAKVQDAVKSLARDPAVWRAVLSNEKVQELTQTLQDGHGNAYQESTCLEDEGKEPNIFEKMCNFVKGKFLQVIDKVVEILGSIFASVEKTFSSKENSSATDKAVASCMVLAVAVLLVVVVRRLGK